jgi:hypothetical protein
MLLIEAEEAFSTDDGPFEVNESAGTAEFTMTTPTGQYSVTVRDTGFSPGEG